MTCFSPMQGYRSKDITVNGKRKIVFNRTLALNPELPHNSVTVPCGQCVGCRLERSRQWAVRCMHEASMYDDNCFITLTYSDDYLPEHNSLCISDFQKFMKRLRKRFGDGIRFYHCGEYGERHGRPHYHACLFNIDFPDKVLWKVDNGQRLYRSSILEELWPFGHSSVGSVTFDSAAYVARYIMKKAFGDVALTKYAVIDYDSGEIVFDKHPEYTTMSRRPGIGKSWFDKFKSDVFPRDYVVVKGREVRPPKYYDTLYELDDAIDFERVKAARKDSAKKFADNCTPERLEVRRCVKEAQISRLVRNVDLEN